MKKKNGEVEEFFIQILGIIFAFAIMIYGIYYAKTIIVYNNANQIARKYILEMETNGFLSSDDIENLKTEATKSGMTDVSVDASATQVGDTKYGDKVTLTINFKEEVKKIDFSDFSLRTVTDPVPVTITKSSTAKFFNTK
jgi:hypothetical protein